MENNHLLIEEWLLSDADLAPDDAARLEHHLETCTSCQHLSQAWREVEVEFTRAPMLTPAPHFTKRWETRLVAERLKRERTQTILVLYLCAGSVLVLLAWLCFWAYPMIKSPYPLLLVSIYQLTVSIRYFASMGDLFFSVIQAITSLVPATLWIALSVALGSLGVLWIIAYKKLISPRRVLS